MTPLRSIASLVVGLLLCHALAGCASKSGETQVKEYFPKDSHFAGGYG